MIAVDLHSSGCSGHAEEQVTEHKSFVVDISPPHKNGLGSCVSLNTQRVMSMMVHARLVPVWRFAVICRELALLTISSGFAVVSTKAAGGGVLSLIIRSWMSRPLSERITRYWTNLQWIYMKRVTLLLNEMN